MVSTCGALAAQASNKQKPHTMTREQIEFILKTQDGNAKKMAGKIIGNQTNGDPITDDSILGVIAEALEGGDLKDVSDYLNYAIIQLRKAQFQVYELIETNGGEK